VVEVKMTRVLQFNIEDEEGIHVPEITGKRVVELALRIHANTVVVFARDAWGRAFYQSRIAPKHPKLGGRDLLRELVDEARKAGLAVVVMIGHTANKHLYETTDWAQRDASGRVIAMDKNPASRAEEPRWPLMCLNSPFLDYVLEEAREVLEYGVSGVFLDSFRYMPDPEAACFCRYCEEAYRREAGSPLPRRAEWGSLEHRRCFEWRYGVLVRALRRVKSALPEHAVLVYNSHPAGWGGRPNRVVELAREHIDIVFAECAEADYQPPGFIAEMTRLTLAMSGGKPTWVSRNSFHTCLTTTATSPLAVRQGLREAFIAGGYPLYLVFSSALAQDRRVAEPAAQVFKEIEALEGYMSGAEPVKYAAVLFSNRSRDLSEESWHMTDSPRGFYYALLWSHLPVAYISDRDLDEGRLAGYKLLILPNVTSMSDRAAASIERFVEQGGALIATHLTSALSESGEPLEDFKLSSTLGVSYMGLAKLPWSYIKVTGIHPVVGGFKPGDLLLWGDFDRDFTESRVPPKLAWHTEVKPHDGTQVLAELVAPAGEYGNEYENGRAPPLASRPLGLPAIAARGRVVYFTGQLGRLFWRIGHPDLHTLITSSATWAAGKPKVAARAPETVEVSAFQRKGLLIIHLLNYTYNQKILAKLASAAEKTPFSTPDAIHPPRSIIPVHDITLELRGYTPTSAYSPISQIEYKLEERGACWEIKVPKLTEYEAIVVEAT